MLILCDHIEVILSIQGLDNKYFLPKCTQQYLKGSEGIVDSSRQDEECVKAGKSHEQSVEAVAEAGPCEHSQGQHVSWGHCGYHRH